MAIPLLTLAAYAFSAKVKGERNAAAAAAEHERKMREEAEKNKVTFGQVWTNGVDTSIVEQGSAAAARLAMMDGWRVVQTGPMKELKFEIEKEEKKSVPMFFDISTDAVLPMGTNVAANPYATQIGNYNTETGQGSYFEKAAANWMSSDKMQELQKRFYPSMDPTPLYFNLAENKMVPAGIKVDLTDPANKDIVQVGTRKSDGTANFYSDEILKGMGVGEDNLAKTVETIYSANHPKGTFTGSLAGLNAWLNKNNISYDDGKLAVASQIQTTKAGVIVGQTAPQKFNLAEKIEGGEPIKDVLITFEDKDGNTQRGFLSNMDMTLITRTNVISQTEGIWQNGKFIPSEFKLQDPPADPAAADKTAAAQQAAKLAAYEIRLNLGDDVTIGFGPAEVEANTNKVQLLSTQVAANQTAVKDFFKQNPNDPQIPAFVEGVFSLIVKEFESVVPAGDELFQVNRNAYSTSAQFAADKYKSLVDMIPGLAKRFKDYDEGNRRELEQRIINENTGPGTEAVVTTVTVPKSETQLPVDYKVIVPIQYPTQYKNVVETVLKPVLQNSISRRTDIEDPESEVNNRLQDFINYEKDFQGRIVADEQNRYIISDDQPVLEFFAGLRPGELERLQTGLAPRDQATSLNDLTQDVLSRYADIFNGDVEKAVNITRYLLPSSAGVNKMMDQKYGFGGSVVKRQDFINGQRDVQSAASRGLQIALSAKETYLDENGNLRDSSAVGNILLAYEGLKYLAKRGAEGLGVRLTDFASNTVSAYVSDAQQALNSRGKFVSTPEGQNAIQAEINAIQRNVDAAPADNKAYAQREFFTLVLAYEVAAAIQGGTGGRTISDQDVALIFRGLRQRWTDSPESQVAALDAVMEMLQRFSFRADMLTSDGKSRAAYLMTEDMFTRNGIRMDFSMQGATNYFNRDAPAPTQDGVAGVSEADIDKATFNRIILNKQARGEQPPVTMEEAKKLPSWDADRAKEIADM